MVTRSQILQVAGRIFADKGFERATSREICAAAGTNLAAVNYHFGGKDGLYDAVLVEAHDQLVALDALESIVQSGASPQAQLRSLIVLFMQRSPGSDLSWGLKVLLPAMVTEQPGHIAALLQRAVLPKVQLVHALIARILGVAVDDPVTQRALAFVVMPCIMLAIAPRAVLGQVLPALTQAPQALVDDMSHYALAGLRSLARRHRDAG